MSQRAIANGVFGIEDYMRASVKLAKEHGEEKEELWLELRPGQILARAESLETVQWRQLDPIHGLLIAACETILRSGTSEIGPVHVPAGSEPKSPDAELLTRLDALGAVVLKPADAVLSTWSPNQRQVSINDCCMSSIKSTSACVRAVLEKGAFAGLAKQLGGSILHAAFSGQCFGLVPTWGTITTHGLPAALSTRGFFARCVGDLEVVSNAVIGKSTRLDSGAHSILPAVTIGLWSPLPRPQSGSPTVGSMNTMRSVLQDGGARLGELDLPEDFTTALAMYAEGVAAAASRRCGGNPAADEADAPELQAQVEARAELDNRCTRLGVRIRDSGTT